MLSIVLDLSNEVLKIDFGQGAAKMMEVKVEAQRKSAILARPERNGFESG